MNTFLHAHGAEEEAGGLFSEVFMHGLLDTLKILPFLFLTYIIMELIEHKASSRAKLMLERSGKVGPLIGGTLGAVPQCGFSAMAANFYTSGVISMGALISVFLSTSDEMLPIMLANSVPVNQLLFVMCPAAHRAVCGKVPAVSTFLSFCNIYKCMILRRVI